ncbi:MAG: enoyl-CoA hydratase/isomerase family protein [Gammaproteobacteria bacterium]
MSQLALREEKDGVVIVTLNRPEKLNAMNKEMRDVIFQAVEDLRERDDLRVLLIKAKGRYFTAGVDIVGDGGISHEDAPSMVAVRRDYRRGLHIFLDEMEAVEKPIVMAIHGPCLGLGVEMAGAVDFRLAAESARFGLPEIDIGVIAGSGGTSRFTRLCGVGWSKWLSMAGEQIDARTAMMAGFVQAVYPDDKFEDEVWAFCQRLQLRPPEVQGVAKLAVELCWDLDRQQARHVERIVNTPLMMRDNSDLVAKVLSRGKNKKQ